MTPPKPGNFTYHPNLSLNFRPSLGMPNSFYGQSLSVSPPQSGPGLAPASNIMIGLEIPFDGGTVSLLLGNCKIPLRKMGPNTNAEVTETKPAVSPIIRGVEKLFGAISAEATQLLDFLQP